MAYSEEVIRPAAKGLKKGGAFLPPFGILIIDDKKHIVLLLIRKEVEIFVLN